MIYERLTRRVPVEKGWSADKKYRVTDRQGGEYLLRISPLERLEEKRSSFAHMKLLADRGVPMCRPVEVGVCAEGAYFLQSWVDGRDAVNVIPLLSHDEQYRYGLEAGQALKRIHSIPAPEGQTPWDVYFNAKMDRKLDMYRDCPLKYDGGQALVDFISANRGILTNRAQVYQHGDYHIGNMMIDGGGRLVIIDFDKDSFGDPWEEFNRIVWSVQEGSGAFASGMVDGYFDGAAPELFWRLLALYIASNTLGSLSWAIPFGPAEVQTMRRQAADVLEWYDGTGRVVPSWYETR